jgi:hypothetical protein
MILVEWIFDTPSDKELNQLRNGITRRFGNELLGSGKFTYVKLRTFLKKSEGR